MQNQGVGTWPHRASRQAPDATAIVFRDQRMSYRELDDRVTRLAHALADLGVHRGDRVALLSANHPVYLEALFAAGLLGAILVPLNARLTAPEVTYALTDSGATVLIHSADLGPVASAAAHDAGTSRRVVVDGDPDDDALGYEQLIADADAARIDIPVGHEEPCFIMYTSGTTGNPKGVVLTHGGVTFAVLNPILDLDIAADEVSLVVAPLFHTAAMNFVSLPTILKGGTDHPRDLRPGSGAECHRRAARDVLLLCADDARRHERASELGTRRSVLDPTPDRRGRAGTTTHSAHLHRTWGRTVSGLRFDRDRSRRAHPQTGSGGAQTRVRGCPALLHRRPGRRRRRCRGGTRRAW